MMSDLFTATRPNDLPPKWDGHPVEWRDWQLPPQLIVCPPVRRDCCPRCASIAERPCNRGTARINPRTQLDLLRAGRTGRAILITLVAFRCTDCRHDQVLEVSTGKWWDLGPDDYQDEGSY